MAKPNIQQPFILIRAAANDYFYCRLIYRLFIRLVDSSVDYFSINLFIIFLSVDEFFS